MGQIHCHGLNGLNERKRNLSVGLVSRIKNLVGEEEVSPGPIYTRPTGDPTV